MDIAELNSIDNILDRIVKQVVGEPLEDRIRSVKGKSLVAEG